MAAAHSSLGIGIDVTLAWSSLLRCNSSDQTQNRQQLLWIIQGQAVQEGGSRQYNATSSSSREGHIRKGACKGQLSACIGRELPGAEVITEIERADENLKDESHF